MHFIATYKVSGGCLGATGRGRKHMAAILVGEVPKTDYPTVSEWGNPFVRKHEYFVLCTRKFEELMSKSFGVRLRSEK